MCGIVGFIGNSTNPQATFALADRMMVKTEVRGDHATGFWTTGGDDDNHIIYHKEPIKSSEFVRLQIWKETISYNPNLLLGHCRYTSANVGSERINKNNHPHVSKDYRVALIHNGRIAEYNYLKPHYKLQSDCDSEILLRMFQTGEMYRDQADFLKKIMPDVSENTDIQSLARLYGIREIFSKILYGLMAVAIGERGDNYERNLWLFRNHLRPITIIDLRDQLGQIFFCSTPEVYRAAVDEVTSRNSYFKELLPMSVETMELPPDTVYHFFIDAKNELKWERIDVVKKKRFGYQDYIKNHKEQIEKGEIPKPGDLIEATNFEVITRLTETGEIIPEKPKSVMGNRTILNEALEKNAAVGRDDDIDPDTEFPKPQDVTIEDQEVNNINMIDDEADVDDAYAISENTLDKFNDLCDEISDRLKRIQVGANDTVKERGMSNSEFMELLTDMEHFCKDLEGTAMSYDLKS